MPGDPASSPDAVRPGLIQHAPTGLRPPAAPSIPDSAVNGVPTIPSPAAAVSKIRSFSQSLGGGRHEDKWSRSPNANGTGAIHVKSFHCKLTGDSLEFLDQQINEWLDAHPQYEVKFVTSAVGEWTGKLKEPNLIVMVWV